MMLLNPYVRLSVNVFRGLCTVAQPYFERSVSVSLLLTIQLPGDDKISRDFKMVFAYQVKIFLVFRMICVGN